MKRPLGALGEGLFELGIDAADVHGPVRRGYGGDAPNAAVMAARMGAPATLLTSVGDDALGRSLLRFWRDSGVDVSHVRVQQRPTGIYVNEDTGSGHRFDYHRSCSAGSALSPDAVDPWAVADLHVLHLTGITLSLPGTTPTAAWAALSHAKRAGVPVSFALNHRAKLAPDASVLSAAAAEARFVFASRDDLRAVFGDEGGGPLIHEGRELIVTDGAEACELYAYGHTYRVQPPQVQLADAAGAGDALAGAYLAARIAGREPPEALAIGVTAASLSCARRGCALSYPNRDEVLSALAGVR